MDAGRIDCQHSSSFLSAAMSAFPLRIQIAGDRPPVEESTDGMLLIQVNTNSVENRSIAAMTI